MVVVVHGPLFPEPSVVQDTTSLWAQTRCQDSDPEGTRPRHAAATRTWDLEVGLGEKVREEEPLHSTGGRRLISSETDTHGSSRPLPSACRYRPRPGAS